MVTLVIAIALLVSPAGDKKTLGDNTHVKIHVQIPKKISAAKNGAISFSFSPNDGIHINTEPLFEFVPEKNSPFEVVGAPRFGATDKGYLDLSKAIEYTIKAKTGTVPGKYSLKGKLFYFYCSDAEGWCNRFSQPIDLMVEVTK